MQQIAAEFGFSETAFVLPSRRADCVRRVRIFTPEAELPFAGHPTIGTAIALVEQGFVAMPEAVLDFAFDLEAGPTPVTVRRDDRVLEAELTAPRPPVTGPSTPVALAAAALGLPPSAIDAGAHPPLDVGVGLPFVVVRLTDADTLAAARRDRDGLARLPTPGGRHGVVCYVPDGAGGSGLRVRVFGNEIGIDEDPATGSAAAALTGLLAGLDLRPEGRLSYAITQGVEMGRPSAIRAVVVKAGGRVVEVRIAGTALTVTEGWMVLPNPA
jgi:trans-2,3-dihydro-3-hydroxyanthranilate isomerase